MEPRVPYTFDVLLTIDLSEDRVVEVPLRFDGYSDLDPAIPSDFYDEEGASEFVMIRPVYDESKIPSFLVETESFGGKSSGASAFMAVSVLAFASIILAGTLWFRRNTHREEDLTNY